MTEFQRCGSKESQLLWPPALPSCLRGISVLIYYHLLCAGHEVRDARFQTDFSCPWLRDPGEEDLSLLLVIGQEQNPL